MNEGLVSLNGEAELASDTGRERRLRALTQQMFPTTLRAKSQIAKLVDQSVCHFYYFITGLIICLIQSLIIYFQFQEKNHPRLMDN